MAKNESVYLYQVKPTSDAEAADAEADNDERFEVKESTIKALLTIPYDLREVVRDLEDGDITRNDLADYLSALANSLERNTKWLKRFL